MYAKRNLMKGIFYKMMFTAILLAGIVIGIVKGQEARQKWVSKKKVKYEAKRTPYKNLASPDNSQVVLDEIEMATYHHSI
jgi:hypothetical protein